MRLHFSARKQHSTRKAKSQQSRPGGELGSKGMAMRLPAKKCKRTLVVTFCIPVYLRYIMLTHEGPLYTWLSIAYR